MVDSTGMKTVCIQIQKTISNSLKFRDMGRKFIRTRSVKDITISTGLKKERFFSQDKRESLINAITANPEKVDLTGEDQGNALRIDIYHSDKEGKAYVQLFEYVPYKYEPCSRMHELELDKAHRLIGR